VVIVATDDYLARFVAGYWECEDWVIGSDTPESEIEPSAGYLAEGEADCRDFVEANRELLTRSDLTPESAGHDFYLTRNYHGAGYWDRGLGEVGEKLSDATKPYGETCRY
jgi:hypothetical protein